MKTVEVFADVRCPFTHVGLRRLVEQRTLRGVDVRLRVRAWPLELVNGADLDAGLIAEEVDALRSQVAPDLFAAFDAGAFPSSSLPALGLAAAAYDRDIRLGERVSLALRDAFFEEGRDIAKQDELDRVAASVGLPPGLNAVESVHADWHEGQARGVIGSPHFFVDEMSFFCPALDIDRTNGHLRITPSRSTFDAFIDECLAA